MDARSVLLGRDLGSRHRCAQIGPNRLDGQSGVRSRLDLALAGTKPVTHVAE